MSPKNQDPLAPAAASGKSPQETSADKLFKTAFGMVPRSLVELTRPRLAARLDLDMRASWSPPSCHGFQQDVFIGRFEVAPRHAPGPGDVRRRLVR